MTNQPKPKMTVHGENGCAWASGELQWADTDQTKDWRKVTCRACLRHRYGADPRFWPERSNRK